MWMQTKEAWSYFFLDTVYILLETLVEVSTDKYTQWKSESGIPISQVKAEEQLRWL